jgi:uncharacterized RDD family membrane protein YckC
MNYATFRQRFNAAWIDVLVLLPIGFLQGWLEAFSKDTAFLLVVPMALVYSFYTVYFHGRYGQTIGKMVMGIRVLRLTGEDIGWSNAWRRSSVDIGFSILGIVSTFAALLMITDPEYYGVGWMQRTKNLQLHEPEWLSWCKVASQIWIWSEVVVMLFNTKRRALHDFIAGTVVVADAKAIDGRPTAAQPCGAGDAAR